MLIPRPARTALTLLVTAVAVMTPLACTSTDPAPLVCRGLEPGSYRPDARTTGVAPGSSLRQVTGDVIVREAGTVIENQDIHRYVDVRAADVVIRNSIVRGGPPAGGKGLINATNVNVRNLKIDGVKLVPEFPTLALNGIQGHDYTARCVDVSETVDGFRAHFAGDPTKPTNVTITQSWCHDLGYWSPDPGHADNQTHNDCFQGEGAVDVELLFNTLDAYVSKTVGSQNYPPDRPQAMSAMMINDLVVAGVTYQPSQWTVIGNWINGGFFAVNGGDTALHTNLGVFLRNTFDYGAYLKGPPTHTIVVGPGVVVNTGDGTADQNVYTDGKPITVRRYK
jgi:hypothetical protein